MTHAAPTPDVIYRTCDRLIAVAWSELNDVTGDFLLSELERLEVDLESHLALKIAEGICDVIDEEHRSELTASRLQGGPMSAFPASCRIPPLAATGYPTVSGPAVENNPASFP